MIISCIKCNKKFNVEDDLIPELGRILECGSCSHQWHYIPILVINKNIELKKNNDITKNIEPTVFDKQIKKNNSDKEEIIPDTDNNKEIIPEFNINNNENLNKDTLSNDVFIPDNKKKRSNFLSNLLVIIITFIGLIIILDTFRIELSNIFPNLDLYLFSFYDIVTDISLFITNLIR